MQNLGQGRASQLRLAPLLGLLGVILLAAGIFSGPSSPDDKASGATVIAWFTAHHTSDLASNILAAFSVVGMLAFVILLYDRFTTRRNWAAMTGMVGFVITMSALLFGIGFDQVLVDNYKHLSAPTVQAVYVLDQDWFLPIPVGLLIFGIFFGAFLWATKPRRGLRWMGLVAVILGILVAVPGINFIALLGWPLWVAGTSIWVTDLKKIPAPAPEVAEYGRV